MAKKKVYKRKFKDGEHNYHLKAIKKKAVKKALSQVKPKLPERRKLEIVDYVLIVVALLSLAFVILLNNH